MAQFATQLGDAIALGAKVGVFWWTALGLVIALFRLEFGEPNYPPWRRAEIFSLWALVSLMAIAFVADRIYVALTIACVGGGCLGYLATDFSVRLVEPDGETA